MSKLRTPPRSRRAASPRARATPPASRDRAARTALDDAGATDGARDEGLARAEDVLLAEACRRGREVLASAESAMADYGQWLLSNLFADDARAVLDREIEHPVWLALVRATESARFPLGRATVANALRVAAYDKRLADGAWDRLSYSHKVALLPLSAPKAMRAAARHTLAASLSVRQCAAYVQTLREQDAPGRRKLSPAAARRALGAMHERFEHAADVKRFAAQLARLDETQRGQATAQLESLVQALSRVLAAVRAQPDE
jgi:hypothetical protein